MRKMSRFKYAVLGVFLLVVALAAAGVVVGISDVPGEIFLVGGNSQVLDVGFPFELEMEQNEESVAAVTLQGNSLKNGGSYSLSQPLVISGQNQGNCKANLMVFGIKVKEIRITVMEEAMLIPGGQSIGVLLHTKGALVVGSMNIRSKSGEQVNPAKVAGLQAGDIIEKYNGTEIKDAAHLSELINREEGEARLSVRRGDQILELTICPVQDADDGLWKLGVWVRDSTLGVGTLTFYDPASKKFAGLGHAITDVDTGKLLTVKDGEIVESEILEVVKGEEGEPGELRGSFGSNDEVIGYIKKNTDYGLYGNAAEEIENDLYQSAIPAAKRDEVKVGDATLLCTLDDGGIQEYSCQIVKVTPQNSPAQKSFIVKIDDEKLLSITGGIVQGMSGSPVIQDGKLIGAVTHVFVNDPTQGYGVYLDWMLSEMYSVQE